MYSAIDTQNQLSKALWSKCYAFIILNCLIGYICWYDLISHLNMIHSVEIAAIIVIGQLINTVISMLISVSTVFLLAGFEIGPTDMINIYIFMDKHITMTSIWNVFVGILIIYAIPVSEIELIVFGSMLAMGFLLQLLVSLIFIMKLSKGKHKKLF